MTPTLRYPKNPITPHGAYHILHDRIPQMAWRSYDDTTVFNLLGGLSIADRTMPEAIKILDLKGLIPPWQSIRQKGAQQDGASYVTSLYDPMEVDLVVEARGRNPAHMRRVLRDWIASWDAKQPGELSWFTHSLGRWWAPLRWEKQPVDKILNMSSARQRFTMTGTAYDAFWRSYDSVDTLQQVYQSDYDTFATAYPDDLGPDWDLAYSGGPYGHIYTWLGRARWAEKSNIGRTVVARRNTYTSGTNNQVVTMQLGSFGQWAFLDGTFNDLWARMPAAGTPGRDGVRARIGRASVRLSFFVDGDETLIREYPLIPPPLPLECFTLVAGYPEDERRYAVLRDGLPLMIPRETGTASHVGADYRSAGFGMHAGNGILSQASPSTVMLFTAGDNTTRQLDGFLTRINVGDQDMWDRLTLYGPGTFYLGDGPSATQYVKVGPVGSNQVVQIRTDPRKRSIVDLTSTPSTPGEQSLWQQALADFLSFATAGHTNALLTTIESLFGITPHQGNLLGIMDGRFSKPIPAKSPGKPAEKYHVPCYVTGATVHTRIVAAGTPLRRFPY